MEESKTQFYVIAKPSNFSNAFEETFLTGSLKPPGTAIRCRIKRRKKEEEHARLPAQMSGSRVSRNPGGNNRQERMDAVSGLKDGKHRADNAWARQPRQKNKESTRVLRGKAQCVAKQHESSSSHRLAIFATLPTAKVEVTRTKWHGTTCNCLHHREGTSTREKRQRY